MVIFFYEYYFLKLFLKLALYKWKGAFECSLIIYIKIIDNAMSLIASYLPFLFVGIISLGFAPLAWLVSRLIRPSQSTKWTEETYECGSVPIGDARVQFRFQYYAFALIFVVFDLVVTFLMIWAVAFAGLSDAATVWMLLFLAIMLIGVAYALKKEEEIWI